MQKEAAGKVEYRDCTRCVDVKSSTDWSPDVIIRRRQHPATILHVVISFTQTETNND